jgi:hypothetical protein
MVLGREEERELPADGDSVGAAEGVVGVSVGAGDSKGVWKGSTVVCGVAT